MEHSRAGNDRFIYWRQLAQTRGQSVRAGSCEIPYRTGRVFPCWVHLASTSEPSKAGCDLRHSSPGCESASDSVTNRLSIQTLLARILHMESACSPLPQASVHSATRVPRSAMTSAPGPGPILRPKQNNELPRRIL